MFAEVSHRGAKGHDSLYVQQATFGIEGGLGRLLGFATPLPAGAALNQRSRPGGNRRGRIERPE